MKESFRLIALFTFIVFLFGCSDQEDVNTLSSDANTASSVSSLSDLTLSSGSLDQLFQPTLFDYTAGVNFLVASVSITATATDSNAALTINGKSVPNGQPSDLIALAEGENTISVVVTAVDNSTSTYTVLVNRQSLNTFAQQAYLKASNTDIGDAFGNPVALDGDTLAVGARGEASIATGINGDQEDNSAITSGAVYIFTRTNGVWSQQAYIKASNTDSNRDFFGRSVALDGDTLAVGANFESSASTGIDGDQSDNSADSAGAVYVFTRSDGVWSQQAYVKASNTDAGDQFGSSVALDGDTLAVGAFNEDSATTGINGDQADNSALSAGAVYVFTRTNGVWSQQAYVKASNTDAGDGFGASVAIDGDTLAIGARLEDSASTGIDGDQSDNSANGAGAVYIFTRMNGVWSQQAYLKASNTDPDDQFSLVALDGDTLAVGAFGEDNTTTGIDGDQSDNSANSTGAVYVFTRSDGVWSQQAYVKASNTGAGDVFGASVAIDGDILAVGARLEESASTGIDGDQSDNSANSAGAVYVFTRSDGVWSQQAYVKASNTDAGDVFGISVAIDGDTLAVGADRESSASTGVDGNQTDNSANNSGAVYVFQ